jgi:uncharacterized protein YjbI with pentapeptide repeats
MVRVLLPKIPAGLRDSTDDRGLLVPRAQFERIILRGIDASNIAAQKMKFDETAVDRLTLINAALDGLTMLDSEVRGSELSAAVMTDGIFNRVRFTGCRMAGIDLSRASLRNVTFSGCKLDMANFRFAKLDGVKFEDCTLIEADFQVGELANVDFNGCTIERAIFDQCKVRAVDARTSELREIHGWRHLRGMTIDHAQLIHIAPELAGEFGLKVE